MGEIHGQFKKQLDNYNIKHIKSRSYNPKYQGSVDALIEFKLNSN